MSSNLSLAERLDALDASLLGAIDAQLDADDKLSLLALHAASRTVLGAFSYLEIGSHLGGSLQSFISDPACTSIVSIDPRPDRQPDERGIVYRYDDNSTERMLWNLSALPGADLAKLATFDADTTELGPEAIPGPPDICFVDGEHTDAAALRDARFCRAVLGSSGCIAFHDAHIVHRGLRQFVSELSADGVAFDAYLLPSCVFVVELGEPRLRADRTLAARAQAGFLAYFWALDAWEPYRREYLQASNRLLRRLRRAVARSTAGAHASEQPVDLAPAHSNS